jgi:hypothetical protein
MTEPPSRLLFSLYGTVHNYRDGRLLISDRLDAIMVRLAQRMWSSPATSLEHYVVASRSFQILARTLISLVFLPHPKGCLPDLLPSRLCRVLVARSPPRRSASLLASPLPPPPPRRRSRAAKFLRRRPPLLTTRRRRSLPFGKTSRSRELWTLRFPPAKGPVWRRENFG